MTDRELAGLPRCATARRGPTRVRGRPAPKWSARSSTCARPTTFGPNKIAMYLAAPEDWGSGVTGHRQLHGSFTPPTGCSTIRVIDTTHGLADLRIGAGPRLSGLSGRHRRRCSLPGRYHERESAPHSHNGPAGGSCAGSHSVFGQ